ncbi:tetratricopeptide repeat protein [Sphingobium sp. Sx8-8]|uniref:tetratricopeptide repeat protein n=1 Tax=Sphingobium sp. Sx8-8 TaxID=2933617 RepID=UPI001F57DE60|nr:tetratricopeptide repeat protein [Sphingobium sp. Sx8-8]
MAGRDDIGFSLADPPPPAPARREAAIEAALARFDGSSSAAPVAAPGSRRFWRPLTGRPYLGTALALSLLALIVAPVAWLEMPRRTSSGTLHVMESPPPGPPASDQVEVPKARVQQEPRAVEPKPTADRAIAAPARSPEAPAKPSPPAAQERANQSAPQALMQAEAVMAAPPPAAPAPPAAAMTVNAARSAGRAETGSESEDARDVVVTGMRADPTLLRGRGDWNACTVGDPERNLALCKMLIDPDTNGDKASANAQIADGLGRAWAGDWEGAITAFDRAIAIAPKSAQAHLNRGLAYQVLGDDDRALADLDKAVRYAPGSARGYYSRSLLQKQRGDTRKAEADRKRAAQLDSRYEP